MKLNSSSTAGKMKTIITMTIMITTITMITEAPTLQNVSAGLQKDVIQELLSMDPK